MRIEEYTQKSNRKKGFGIHQNMSMNEYGYERKIDENMKLTRKNEEEEGTSKEKLLTKRLSDWLKHVLPASLSF